MYDMISIGLDQSYTRTGIGISIDGDLKRVSSEDFRGCSTKSDKRLRIRQLVTQLITLNKHKAKQMVIICEKVRTFSQGGHGTGQFISTSYIKATGALIATIVDVAYEHGVRVFSVDTRSWKAQILGHAGKGANASNKTAAIKFVESKGFSVHSTNKKGQIVYDDDAADGACISLYAFVPKEKRKLMLEE